jgi:hypothetical protein
MLDNESKERTLVGEVISTMRHATENGKKSVRQIVFKGERFDVASVRRWRDRVLATAVP